MSLRIHFVVQGLHVFIIYPKFLGYQQTSLELKFGLFQRFIKIFTSIFLLQIIFITVVVIVVMVENIEIESFLLQLDSFDINKHQIIYIYIY